MVVLFYLFNGAMGTAGSYLLFKKFRHLGLAAAGASLVVGSFAAMGDDDWWPMLAACGVAALLFKVIGDPLDA